MEQTLLPATIEGSVMSNKDLNNSMTGWGELTWPPYHKTGKVYGFFIFIYYYLQRVLYITHLPFASDKVPKMSSHCPFQMFRLYKAPVSIISLLMVSTHSLLQTSAMWFSFDQHKLLTFYNIFGVFMMPIMLVYQYFLIERILATNMLGPSSLMNWVKQLRGSRLWVKSSCRKYKWTICVMEVVNFSIKSPVVLNHFFKIHLLNGQITLPFAWKSPFWIHINTFLTSLETSKAIN